MSACTCDCRPAYLPMRPLAVPVKHKVGHLLGNMNKVQPGTTAKDKVCKSVEDFGKGKKKKEVHLPLFIVPHTPNNSNPSGKEIVMA